MKAVILAGGEGERLRPLSLGLPKPMTALFDRPVLEHIVSLLKKHGFTDIAITLRYMPQTIIDWFGDGAALGINLRYYVEEEPLGTAGGVKACGDWLGEEDFLVISGDAVCDLDLGAVMGFHAAERGAATLALHRCAAPLEYGLVLTDAEGRVEKFIEKPGWGEVLTNLVNTGIYVLTRRAMDYVPAGEPFDFGRDLFPLLLERGETLYGVEPEGYWRDMGDCAAYLDSAADALGGRVKLDLPAPKVSPGVWAASPIPEGVEVVPPCYIGENVDIGAGSLIGPHAVLGAGSTVGRRSLVQRSVLQGARVGDRCTLYGAVLCRGAAVGDGAVLNEGAVLGEEAAVGRDAVLLENVKVWPHRTVEPSTRLTASLTHGGLRGPLKFGDGGVIRGTVGEELTASALHLLGNVLGREGQAGLGWSGGSAARMLCQAAGSGMAEGGGRVLYTDAGCPSAASWLAERYDLPVTLFVQQEGERVFLHLFGSDGLPLPRARQRKIEGLLGRGEVFRMPAGRVGSWETVTGIRSAYAADAARRAGERGQGGLTVAVPGSGGADAALALALENLGCTVLRQAQPGVPAFQTGHGGFTLTAWDEGGRELSPQRVLTLCALVELDRAGRAAVPALAPAAIDLLAARRHGTVLRLGRDGKEAGELYAAQPALRDAVFAACLLCAHMTAAGERLRVLDSRVPLFRIRRAEVPLKGDRGAVMEALRRSEPKAQDAGEGLRLPVREGWVYIAPLTARSALRVIGEGFDMETAEELCDLYVRKTKELDQ